MAEDSLGRTSAPESGAVFASLGLEKGVARHQGKALLHSRRGFFPRPQVPGSPQSAAACKSFRFLGRLMAKALRVGASEVKEDDVKMVENRVGLMKKWMKISFFRTGWLHRSPGALSSLLRGLVSIKSRWNIKDMVEDLERNMMRNDVKPMKSNDKHTF